MDIEESIKVLDEIAKGFENLSAEVCARNDLIALWAGRAKGIRQAIAVINARLRVQPNEPLTLEELREMDGEPVWIASPDGWDTPCWMLVDVEYELCREAHGGLAAFENYGKTWLAYRRKPEEGTA